MARFRHLLLFAVLSVVAFVGSAARSAAQALDDKWFKASYTASGYTIDSVTGALKKASFKQTAYWHLVWNGTGYNYDIFVNTGTRTSPNWQSTYSDSFTTDGADEGLIVDLYSECDVSGTNWIGGYMTCLVAMKKDKNGAVTSATITALGAELTDGQLGPDDFRGGYKFKATTVAVSKLPFVP